MADMLRRGLLAGVAALVLWTAPAHAIVRLDSSFDVTDADYLDFAEDFPSVGRFGSGSGALGGVLIAPNYVLTAGHVAGGLTVGVSSFTVAGQTFTVTNKVIHPNFSASPFIHDDIAVVQLSGNATGVTPAVLYTGSAELGTVGAWVGFGETGTGLTGANGTGRGTARAGTNVLDIYGQYLPGPVPPEGIYTTSNPALGTMLLADFDNNTVGNNTLFGSGSSQVPSGLEAGLAIGDSGGAVFSMINSTIVLTGISSFNAPGSGSGTQYGALLGATRVSAYSGWIMAQIPEPGEWAALAGLAALAAAAMSRTIKRRPRMATN